MIETPSTFHIDGLELSFAPKAWVFSIKRRAKIDAYFESATPGEAGDLERSRVAVAPSDR
jgi:hypothetical protein